MANEGKKLQREAMDEEVEIKMTPMIDIIFQLLIFFMLACRFKTQEGELKAFLPKNRGMNTAGTPAITLQEVRVKLLWVEKGSYRETSNKKGRVLLKVRDIKFPYVTDDRGNLVPNYKKLYKYVCSARDNFRPTRSYKSLPVIIDARKLIPFEHVVFALNECVRAGIKEITFAAPEIDY